MNTPRLLVVQHEDECPPGWFGEWFDSVGLEYDVVAAHRREPVPTSLAPWSGLLVLGGDMGAYDDAAHPWLTPTKALISSTVAAGQPLLGICLGHQLAAVALGGQVAVNSHGHARGLTPFEPTGAAADDILFTAISAGSPTVMWNNDIVTRLPDGATALATSPDGTVQAARFASRAWGVQFHPETSPEIFADWTVNKPSSLSPDGIDVPAAARAISAAEADLRRAWRPLATRFAETVLEREAHGALRTR